MYGRRARARRARGRGSLMLALLLSGVLLVRGAAAVPQLPAPVGFDAVYPGLRVNGSQLVLSPESGSVAQCAAACRAEGTGCIAFNWVADAVCELSGWSANYTVFANESSVYYTKSLPRNDTAIALKIPYELNVPTSGVELHAGPFARAFQTNLGYLQQFPVDDMLFWFRQRAGVANPPDATSWGWDGHVEPLASPIAIADVDDPHALGAQELQSWHCNPGGDPTATVNGEWKATNGAVYSIAQPAHGSFAASGPGWPPGTHGHVFPNGSFRLSIAADAESDKTATGIFSNASSWEKLCWWTTISWFVPPPGVAAGDSWCKVTSPGCKAPPGPPPPPAGVPPGRNIDGPFGLRGSVAGAFMMGSGGATRWQHLPELHAKLEQVVGNISALAGEDGFAMAFLRNETNSKENPDYVQSWVTHGLLEAAASGLSGALHVLRRHFDWYNYETDVLARQLPPLTAPPGASHPDRTSKCSMHQRMEGHCVYLIYQGMIHNTRVASSPVGTARDLQVVQELYQEDWWLDGLAARNTSMIWLREAAHNYEITAFEAYLDVYVLTGDVRYLAAMEGAWELMRNHWIHVGGSIALNEGGAGVYPPGSYYLGQHPTGELCGSSFWIRFNQRYQRLRPSQEVYSAEIERSLINVILANQASADSNPPGIRYFAQLEGSKAIPTNVVTCCESQGTRTYGALPEFLYSNYSDQIVCQLSVLQHCRISGRALNQPTGTLNLVHPGTTMDGVVFVHLFAPSTFKGDGFNLTQSTGFPGNGTVSLFMSQEPRREAIRIMLRIPSWSVAHAVPVTITESAAGKKTVLQTLLGTPGSYLPVNLSDVQQVDVSFPMSLRTSLYNGSAPIDSFQCNSRDVVRAAVEWGPTLLAATYSQEPRCGFNGSSGESGPDAPAVAIIGVDPRDVPASSWLSFTGHDQNGDPIFAVQGTANCTLFRSYYSLQNESFSVYPSFVTSAGLNQRGQCGVTEESVVSNTTSTVCLVCPAGQHIAEVTAAQFGVLSGNCTSGTKVARCAADSTVVTQVARQHCVGRPGCSVPVDPVIFGAPACTVGARRALAVSVRCIPQQCAMAAQKSAGVRVGCPAGQTISAVLDAQFGLLVGNCTAGFSAGRCAANTTHIKEVVARMCVRNHSCVVPVDTTPFGIGPSNDPCPGATKTLAVKVACGSQA